jgi:hypothetical protein
MLKMMTGNGPPFGMGDRVVVWPSPRNFDLLIDHGRFAARLLVLFSFARSIRLQGKGNMTRRRKGMPGLNCKAGAPPWVRHSATKAESFAMTRPATGSSTRSGA